MRGVAAIFCVLILVDTAHAADPCPNAPTRLTVVVILASTTKTEINPKLKALAEEVRKTHETLTGFRIETTLQKSVPTGASHTFELVDKQPLKVTVESAKDKNGRVGLVVVLPGGMDEVTYSCACDKFFPLVTPHKTKAGDHLIIAILAKPCTGMGP